MALHAHQLTLLQAADDIANFLTEAVRPSGEWDRHLGVERLVDRGLCWIGWLAPGYGGGYDHVALFHRRRARRGFVLEPTDLGQGEWRKIWLPKVAQLNEGVPTLPGWATDVYPTPDGLIMVDVVSNVRVVG